MKDADDNAVDSLFQLPLDEFTKSRNALASSLQKEGRMALAAQVKSLVKPSISAWAVNQIYWESRETFDKLLAAGRKVTQAQVSQLAGRSAEMEKAQAEQRELISALSRKAEALLIGAGHNSTPDLMRRIRTTLETLSSYSSISDLPSPGRLTADVSPPGFESLAALIPAEKFRRVVVPFKPRPKEGSKQKKDGGAIASARAELRSAEQRLRKARTVQQNLAAAQKKAAADVSEAEKKRIEAEELYRKARMAEEEARRRLDRVAAEAEESAKTLEVAEQSVETTREKLRTS